MKTSKRRRSNISPCNYVILIIIVIIMASRVQWFWVSNPRLL